MNREEQAEALALAKDLIDDIELDRSELDKQILKATRLARLVNDEKVLAWLRRETGGYYSNDLEYQYFIATGRMSSVENDRNFAPGTQIVSAVRTLSAELNVLRTPDVSGDVALLAMRAAVNHIATVRNNVNTYNRILSRVSGLLYEFVSKTYHSLRFITKQESLFEQAKSAIDSQLRQLDAASLQKIDAAYSNLQSEDAEAISAAMNSVRRLMDGFTDVVFPATKDTRPHPEGKQPIQLGQQFRMNRLRAFIDDNCPSRSRRKRLGESAASIYGRVSDGVHNDVTKSEAEFLFLTTYILLGEILSLRDGPEEAAVTISI